MLLKFFLWLRSLDIALHGHDLLAREVSAAATSVSNAAAAVAAAAKQSRAATVKTLFSLNNK